MVQPTLTPRRVQTRERLMDAAIAIFASKGIPGASVEEICEAADFTRGAFYSNFADKDELCLALLARQANLELAAVEQVLAGLDPLTEPDASTQEIIAGALRVFLAAQPRTAADLITSVELRLWAIRTPNAREPYLQLTKAMSQRIGELLLAAANQLGFELSLGPEAAVDLLHAVYLHTGVTDLLNDAESDEASRWRQLNAALQSMVLPRPKSQREKHDGDKG